MLAFYDTGAPGTWADAIAHSPCLKVSDHAPGNFAKTLDITTCAECGIALGPLDSCPHIGGLGEGARAHGGGTSA